MTERELLTLKKYVAEVDKLFEKRRNILSMLEILKRENLLSVRCYNKGQWDDLHISAVVAKGMYAYASSCYEQELKTIEDKIARIQVLWNGASLAES